jgi:hypothetical protein
VRNDVDLLHLERVEHAGEVVPLRFLVVATLRDRREPHAAQIGNDHHVIDGELLRERDPHVARLAVAVLQEHGRLLAADAHVPRNVHVQHYTRRLLVASHPIG